MLIRSESVFSPRLGSWLAHAIYLLRGGDPLGQINAQLVQDWGANFNSFWSAGDDDHPSAFFASQLGACLVLIDGASSRTQAARLLQGWTTPVSEPTFGVRNGYVEDLADFYFDRMRLVGIQPTDFLFISGWSLGGVVATVMLRKFSTAVLAGVTTAGVTFGSPREVSDPDGDAVRRYTTVGRWMNNEDAIPLLPPRFGEMPELFLVFNTNQIRNFGKFTHPSSGFALTPEGAMVPTMLPPAASVNFAGAFLNYVVNYWADRGGPHDIATYQQRLARLALSTAPLPPAPPVQHERNQVIPPAEIARQENAARGIVLNLERDQNAAPVSIPSDRLCFAYKLNRLWYVSFNGETIACPGTRRRARNLARQLNDFLRNLQSVAVVDPESVLRQLRDYLDAAGVPQAGFSPVLNTKI